MEARGWTPQSGPAPEPDPDAPPPPTDEEAQATLEAAFGDDWVPVHPNA